MHMQDVSNIHVITNARIFDGEQLLDAHTVVVEGRRIAAIGETTTLGTVTDARGATLLPGLIDAHTHTDAASLQLALQFGVTTELEMTGFWTPEQRREIAERDDVADVRSAMLGLTAPGGHPMELDVGDEHDHSHTYPTVTGPDEAAAMVAERVAQGADYIKIMIEEGGLLGSPGLPVPDDDTLRATVRAAHEHGRMALAHTLTVDTTHRAVAAGMDGLAHLFLDRPHTPEVIAAIAASGAFVVPCLVLNSAIIGHTGAAFAADQRVGPLLPEEWRRTLAGTVGSYPQGDLDDVLATVAALHAAGVDVLAGTDASLPVPALGGLAHGASLHHELRLLVAAGLTPSAALRAATALPARRFGLTDRGRVAVGARADLLLVDGDPTVDIDATLNIRAVWRRGTLARRSVGVS
jgi:imidazolonepropionase-like amidohydrolase